MTPEDNDFRIISEGNLFRLVLNDEVICERTCPTTETRYLFMGVVKELVERLNLGVVEYDYRVLTKV